MPDRLEERERMRLEVLAATGLLDSPPEREFDLLVELASRLTGCKYAAVSLIDRDRQWFKAAHGFEVRETPREQSFCTIAVEQDAMLLVPDARCDPRFAASPFVTAESGIRFYAGMPLHARGAPDQPEVALGTLCVSDVVPRDVDAADLALLRDLARIAEALIRPRFVAAQAAELMLQHRLDIRDLQRSHRQFYQAERMTGIGSWRLSLPEQELEWSDGVFAIHGLPLGATPTLEAALDFYPVQSRSLVAAALERAIAEGTPYDHEVDFLTATGELRRIRAICEAEEIDGARVALLGIFQDVTERHTMEQALRRSATVDDLTGLTNRAGFNALLDARMEQARVTGEPLALLLDLAPDSAAFHAAVEALLADLCHCVAGEGAGLTVSGTIGISLFEAASSRRDLLNRADQALYAGKREQPGTARIFGRDIVFGPAAHPASGSGHRLPDHRNGARPAG